MYKKADCFHGLLFTETSINALLDPPGSYGTAGTVYCYVEEGCSAALKRWFSKDYFFFLENDVGPGKTPRAVASELDLTLLWDAKFKCISLLNSFPTQLHYWYVRLTPALSRADGFQQRYLSSA